MQFLKARARHIGQIAHWWWALTYGFAWTLLCSADVLVGHYGSDSFKAAYNKAWIAPKWGWQAWVIGLLIITVCVVIEGSYRYARSKDLTIATKDAELDARGANIKGEIILAYLDIGKQPGKSSMVNWPSGCTVTFYLNAVNRSDQEAWIVLPPTISLTMNGKRYQATYNNQPENRLLIVDDDELKGDRRVTDLLSFCIGVDRGIMRKPRLHIGWLVFTVEGTDNIQLGAQTDVAGSVEIILKDTLGKQHSIKNEDINFKLNRLKTQLDILYDKSPMPPR